MPEQLLFHLEAQARAGASVEIRVERASVVDAPAFLKAIEALASPGTFKATSFKLGAATLRVRGASFDLDPKEWGPANAAALMSFMSAIGDRLEKPVSLGNPEVLCYNHRLKGFRTVKPGS